MFLTNKEKAKISFNHEEKIKGLFNKHVKNELCIDHFSINIFYGNNQSIFLSPTPQMAEELCKNNLAKICKTPESTKIMFNVFSWAQYLLGGGKIEKNANFYEQQPPAL